MRDVILAIGYSATSATLAVANKWALVRFPYSGTLTLAQFCFAASSVRLMRALDIVQAETLEVKRALKFAPAVVMFYVSIAANLTLLSRATVDTLIVCKAATPIFTQFGEVLFLGKTLPPSKALVCLVLIAVGASGYALHDSTVIADARVVFWAIVYVLCVTADMLVVKKIVTSVDLSSWGYVYYNNALAMCLYPLWLLATNEASAMSSTQILDKKAMFPVAVSSAIGLGISFFGLNARRALSATAFTVLGAACKFLSILINTLCWTRHAPLDALPWLCVSLAGSILYHQAINPTKPRRPLPDDIEATAAPADGGGASASSSSGGGSVTRSRAAAAAAVATTTT